MKFLPALRRFLLVVLPLSLFILLLIGNLVVPHVFAQGTNIATVPTNAEWQFDPVVTEVGKNAERARQLLWWVFFHPAIHTAPVIASLWAFSRNLVYVLIILVIVAFGFSFIAVRKKAIAVNIQPILVKIGMILLYVTFSYVLILALVQISEITMRFFIENVGGKDLFNVIFAGAGNADVNYTGFVGYRDVNPVNQEMANTSLFLIKLTSLTYFVMALIVILRTIILWFLLIVAPFLALLMPFIFIRNVGWIWMGVFFQWLFYGPLMALFLAALTKIWVSGIPFPFDFSRVNTAEGQVYRTSINILYGGPAQTLSAGNSANYIDTYAEYIIALVMLWTAVLLPWLLLRIFRDYCCEAIMASHSTLTAIFDRLRQYPPPPPAAPTPATTSGIAAQLPFRQKVEEKVKEVEKARIEDIRDISAANTAELMRALDLSVSRLSDVSRLEMNQLQADKIKQNLQKISDPGRLVSSLEREKYATLKKELQSRATAGDLSAQVLLSASEKNKEVLASQMAMMGGRRPQAAALPTRGAYAPTIAKVPVTVAGKQVQTHVSVEDYEEVKKMWLKHYQDVPVPTSETVKTRQDWLSTDIRKLTNISNMLAGSDPRLKQKGLEEVAEILPFLMLGGFSDLETLTYLKAKLEAAKQVLTELEIKEKAKEEAKEEIKEEEETLIEVTPKKEEVKKQKELSQAQEIDLPKEEDNDKPKT